MQLHIDDFLLKHPTRNLCGKDWEMPAAILPKKQLPESDQEGLRLLEELAKLRLN